MDWNQRTELVKDWAEASGNKPVLDYLEVERMAQRSPNASPLLLWVNKTRPAVTTLFNKSLRKFFEHYVDPSSAPADEPKAPSNSNTAPASTEYGLSPRDEPKYGLSPKDS